MTYRSRCMGRRLHHGHVKQMRERRRYVAWRLRMEAVQYSPIAPGLPGLFDREMRGSMLMLERILSMAMYRPYVDMGWTSWEEKFRARYRGIPVPAKHSFAGLSAWVSPERTERGAE